MASDLLASYGMRLDAWQDLVLADWLAEVDGRFAALTAGLAVPRQNGKNAVIEAREVFGMIGRGERFLHTAHEVKTARKHFKRLQHFFGTKVADPGARYPELNRLVTEVRSVNGQEAITLSNGGSVEIIARSKNSGRGFTVDVLVLDEAQELSDDDLEALMPTTSAAPLRNPQWIYTGTPPGPRAAGEVFSRVRADALSDKSHRLSWCEWSPEASDLDDIDLDDVDLLASNNPGMSSGRLQLEVALGERARYSPAGYARERLGWWQPESSRVAVLPGWDVLADPSAERGRDVSWGVAVCPDGSWSCIAVAWTRPDGAAHVVVSDYRPNTEWLTARAAELKGRWGGQFTVSTAARGLVGGAEEPAQGAQAQAHVGLEAKVRGGTVRHGNQPELNTAVRAARWKAYGDTRVFDRKGTTDISPLDAAALALHGLVNHQPVSDFIAL